MTVGNLEHTNDCIPESRALTAMVYNAVAVVKGAVISAHDEEAAEQLS